MILFNPSDARLQEQLDEQKKIINRLEYEKGQIERVRVKIQLTGGCLRLECVGGYPNFI